MVGRLEKRHINAVHFTILTCLHSNQRFLLLPSSCSMICLLLAARLALLFQFSYSHLLIFTSFCLSLSLCLSICCLPTPSQHISICLFSSITSSAMFSFNHPLKKYIHLQTTGLLLDHILLLVQLLSWPIPVLSGWLVAAA